jgi:hypothetical protein
MHPTPKFAGSSHGPRRFWTLSSLPQKRKERGGVQNERREDGSPLPTKWEARGWRVPLYATLTFATRMQLSQIPVLV